MSRNSAKPRVPQLTYFVDEAGDGILFGQKGRDRLQDPDASLYFVLGMVSCGDPSDAAGELGRLRRTLLADPLFSGIPSLKPDAGKTYWVFHAKDDHPEVRSKVFELLRTIDFKFYAVVKDMRTVRAYVLSRNQMESAYRYRPNELYDLAVRMLLKNRLHQADQYQIVFARRGKSDRTAALRYELERTRQRFASRHGILRNTVVDVLPAYPWEHPCLQIADYCLWAVQRCYEKHEDRFLRALWPKVSLLHDVDDTTEKPYGRYLNRNSPWPSVEAIKNRRI